MLNDHLFGKDLFIQLTVHVFCEHLSVYVYASFHFCLRKGWMLDLIVFVLDHCLPLFYKLLVFLMVLILLLI